ncbi:MAG: Ig-like domain-containing protein [Lachnospiraceae bacterium]
MKKKGSRIGAFLLAFLLAVTSVFAGTPQLAFAAETDQWVAVEGEQYGNGSADVTNAKPTVTEKDGTVEVGLDYSANSNDISTANIRKDTKLDTTEKNYIGYNLTYPKELNGKLKSTITGIVKEKKPEEKPKPVENAGLHVQGNKLLDGDDNEFIFRGVNLPHAWYTDKTELSINDVADLGANSVRVVLGSGEYRDATDGKKHGYTKTPASEVENIIKLCKKRGLVCVLELHDFTGTDTPENITTRACNYWLEMKDLLNANKDYVIVNIANEWQGTWGKGNLWKNTYVTAVKKLRDAGLENTLMIDATGWGQETGPIISGCKDVLAADTTGNTMFSYHVYSVLGKDSASIDEGLDGLKAKGVCMCVGEFGYWQSKKDVDERYLVDYCAKNNIGWLAWSWAGNGGDDAVLDMTSAVTFSKNDLTEWGKFVFWGKNGIEQTSKLAYNKGSYSGSSHLGEAPESVKNPEHVVPPTPPVIEDKDSVTVDAGDLKSYEWKLCKNGDMNTASTVGSISSLSNGGYRVEDLKLDSADEADQPYPTLYTANSDGMNLSGHSSLDLIVRNTNSEPVQIDLILKTGSGWDWIEPNDPHYIDVAGRMTELISFDISKVPNLNDVKQISFRIQSGTGEIAYPVDFCSMGFDLEDNAYRDDLIEMNRPKTVEAFTWVYPDADAKSDTTTTLKDGKLTASFTDLTDQKKEYGSVQTETKPGLGEGMDVRPYAGINATLTNNSNADIHCNIVVRTGANWTWSENSGVGAGECIIPAGGSKQVSYSFTSSDWKNASTGWQFTGSLEDLDDVRAIAFKFYPGNGEKATGSFTISNFSFQTSASNLTRAAGASNVSLMDVETEENTQAAKEVQDPIATADDTEEYVEKEVFNKNTVFYNKKYDPITKTYSAFVYAPLTGVTETSWDAIKVGFIGVDTAFKGKIEMKDFGVFENIPDPDVQKLPQKLAFDKKTYELKKEETVETELKVEPAGADLTGLTYTSEDETVATIDADGKITAVKSGETTVTASWDDGTVVATAAVKVTTPVKDVTISPDGLKIKSNSTGQLKATITPSDADNQNVIWSVEDETVATVDQTGLVTGKELKGGETKETKVTVTTEDGNISKSVIVTVSKDIVEPETIKVDQTSVALTEGDAPVTLTATVEPENVTDPTVTWTASSEALDLVNNKDGTCTITAKAVKQAEAVTVVATASNGKTAFCTVAVKPKQVIQTPDQIEVSVWPEEKTMVAGDTTDIICNIKHEREKAEKTVESSDENVAVAKLNETDGQTTISISALKEGKADITVKVKNVEDEEYQTAVCHVTVSAKEIPVESVSVQKELELLVGKEADLIATVLPSDATNKNLKWSTDNKSVATVSENGHVTAIAKGEANITVETEDGKKAATCKVTVKEPDPTITYVDGLKFSKSEMELEPGKTASLASELTLSPADATDKTIYWAVTDETVISVKDGEVTAKKPGYAWVTAVSKDGGYMAICRVDVNVKGEETPVEDVLVEKVELKTTEGELHVGEVAKLASYVVISPSNAKNPVVSWVSDHPEIANVKDGTVTAVAEGTANITVSVKTGDVEKTAVYKVKVLPKAEGEGPIGIDIPAQKVTVDGVKSSLTLDYSKSVKTLNVSIIPTTTTNKKLSVKSDNTKILKVSVSGTKLKLTTVRPGVANVTVKSQSSAKAYAKFKVTVRPAKVSGLRVAAASKNSMKLAWKKAANVSGYKVYMYSSSSKKWKCLKTIKSASTTTYTVKKLKKKTTYQYKVTALVKSGSKYIEGNTANAATVKKATKAK